MDTRFVCQCLLSWLAVQRLDGVMRATEYGRNLRQSLSLNVSPGVERKFIPRVASNIKVTQINPCIKGTVHT